MRIKVNGQELELEEGLSVQDLISSRDLAKSVVIVELNQTIIKRELWPETRFKADDNLEIISILGGG